MPARTVLPAFFREMRLPEQLDRAPEPGESISLRYGGYLRLGAQAAVGYKLAGTRSLSVGELELSGLQAAPRGTVKILVTFELDADGILNVRAKDKDSGRETAAKMRLLGANTDANDVAAMVARQARHAVA